jgi:probable F420-dependent oxidoreductase
MEFGIQFSNMEPAKLRDMAQAAEALGFDAIVFPDHLVAEGPERQVEANALMYDAMVMAAAVIDATKKIRVGHLVLCNLFRHPAITAQSLVTLDHLSGGRLLAGLGTGWTETEFQMTGIPFPPITERLAMLEESLQCIESLWTNERTTFEGKYYHFRDAILWPKPLQKPRPPMIIGGGGKGLLRIAARHADYVNIIPDSGKPGKISIDNVSKMTDASFRERIEFVRAEAKSVGRDSSKIKFSNFIFATVLADSPAAARQIAEGMAPMFKMNAEALLASPLGLIGTPEQCVAELKRRAKAWDVSQVFFTGQVVPDEKQLQRLHEEIIAHV